jgi:lipopolysaccharide transport system permease protein
VGQGKVLLRRTRIPWSIPMSMMTLHNRELFANLVRREVRGRYKGSILGVVWTLITPLIMMAAYTLVFTVIWQVVDVPYYPLFLLTGLTFWTFMAGSMTVGASSLVGNADLVKKVAFPRQIVPMAAMISQGLTAGVMLLILIPFGLWFNQGSRWTMLLLIPLVLFSIALVTGLTLAVSVLNVFFRDTEHILTALLLPWFFITPILYSFDSFPLATTHEWLVEVLKYVNFATPFAIAFQDVVLWGRIPPLGISLYVMIAGVSFLAGGWWLFKRLQRDLAVEL